MKIFQPFYTFEGNIYYKKYKKIFFFVDKIHIYIYLLSLRYHQINRSSESPQLKNKQQIKKGYICGLIGKKEIQLFFRCKENCVKKRYKAHH